MHTVCVIIIRVRADVYFYLQGKDRNPLGARLIIAAEATIVAAAAALHAHHGVTVDPVSVKYAAPSPYQYIYIHRHPYGTKTNPPRYTPPSDDSTAAHLWSILIPPNVLISQQTRRTCTMYYVIINIDLHVVSQLRSKNNSTTIRFFPYFFFSSTKTCPARE